MFIRCVKDSAKIAGFLVPNMNEMIPHLGTRKRRYFHTSSVPVILYKYVSYESAKKDVYKSEKGK